MSCIFCSIAEGSVPAKMVDSDDQAVAFLDLAPKHRGHTLVIPRRHVADLGADASALVEIAPLVARVHDRLLAALGADGAKLVVNSGEAAGQEVPHLHVHVMPRYENEPETADDFDAVMAALEGSPSAE